jgi:HK97 family phage major capsid protein
MNLNELKAERGDLVAIGQTLLASVRSAKRDMNAGEQAQHETIIRNIQRIDEKIATCERATANTSINPGSMFGSVVGAAENRTEVWKNQQGGAVHVLAKDQSFALSLPEQHRQRPEFGFGDYIKALVKGSNDPGIRAALSESGGGATGDYTVPTILLPGLIDLMRAKTVCIQAGALTVALDSETTNIARIASDPTPSWRNEAAAYAAADPTFERVQFKPQSLAVLVKVSEELLEDSANVNQALMLAFAGAFGVELDRVALFGTGAAPQPHGISGTSGVGSVDLGTNGLALTNFDPFVDAVQNLLAANASMPTAAIMAPRTLTKAAKLKDSQNQPLRKPDLIQNIPFLATNSVPVNQTHGSSNVASEIIVGDFAQLMFGIRHSLRIRVLNQRYVADNGQIGFVADLRADVQLRHPQSFCEVVGVL